MPLPEVKQRKKWKQLNRKSRVCLQTEPQRGKQPREQGEEDRTSTWLVAHTDWELHPGYCYLFLVARSTARTPETHAAFELPNFRVVAIIGGAKFLELAWRSLKRMMVATHQEANDR